ncbi:MAG: serine/threonine-protein kinase [Candidatus Eremiobacteraeota bacterium]|nr:serine/threonine-protein kinase [Candidatus Eremiobacteraeota bacterium]
MATTDSSSENPTLSTGRGQTGPDGSGPSLSYRGDIPEEDLAAAEGRVPANWQPGDLILGLYEVMAVLGQGAFGTVHRVRHRLWNRDMAVKSLRPELIGSPGHLELFLRECEGWVNLGLHPHVVSCFYVRLLGGLPRIFSEFVAGGTLRDWMKQEKVYEFRLIIDLALQCLSGLAYAHMKGLLHRDIKPENCLVAEGERPGLKVGDFGIASGLSAAGASGGAAASGSTGAQGGSHGDDGGSIGTPSYMPPEQWSRQYGAIGPWSDIYAFGVMLFEICCGARPFDSGTEAMELVRARHIGVAPPDPATLRKDIPPRLGAFMLKCLAKNPRDRFQSCSEARGELLAIYRDLTGEEYPEEDIKAVRLLAGTLSNRGISLIDLGRGSEALGVLGEALALDPGNLHAVYNHSLLCWYIGRITDRALLEKLDAVSTTMVREKAFMRGLINRERGDDEAALADFNAAEKGAPADELALIQDARKEVREGYRPVRTIECGGAFPLGKIALSPQGTIAAACHLELNEIRAWDTATGSLLWSRGNRAPVVQPEGEFFPFYFPGLEFTGDGKVLVAAVYDGSLLMLDAKTGSPLKTLKDRTMGIYDLAVSNDGRIAATRTMGNLKSSGCLTIWDLEKGKIIHSLHEATDAAGNLALAVEGNPLFSSAFNVVRVWDTKSGGLAREFSGARVAISSAGTLALTYQDGFFRLWDVLGSRCIRTLKGSLSSRELVATHCLRLAFDHRGSELMVLDMETLQCLRTLELKSVAGGITLAPRSYFALASTETSLTLWRYPQDPRFPGASFLVASPGGSEEAVKAEKELKKQLSSISAALEQGAITAAVEAYERAKAIEGCGRLPEVLQFWTRLSRLCRRGALNDCWEEGAVTTPLHLLHRGALTRKGSFAVFMGFLETAIWDLSTMKEAVKRKDPAVSIGIDPGGAKALVIMGKYDPYGGVIETAEKDNPVYLWDIAKGQVLRPLGALGGAAKIRAGQVKAAFSVDGMRAVLCHDGRLAIYDLLTGLKAGEVECALPEDLSISPCGRMALAVMKQGGVSYTYFIDVEHDVPVHTIMGLGEILAFSRDGLFSAALDAGGTALLWNVKTGGIVHRLEGQQPGITSMDFTSDGRAAVSVSLDGSFQVWDTKSGRCLKSIGGGRSEDFRMGHPGVAVSARGDRALVWDKRGFRVFHLDWALDACGSSPWDEGARPFLELYLAEHGLTGPGTPQFKSLMEALDLAGLGGVTAEELAEKLREMSVAGKAIPLVQNTGEEMTCW